MRIGETKTKAKTEQMKATKVFSHTGLVYAKMVSGTGQTLHEKR